MLLWYRNLMSKLRERTEKIKATMDLNDITEVYAENVCALNHWKKWQVYPNLSDIYCEISFAYMNGYIKAINDNGFEFRDGLVKPIDPNKDCLGGSHEPYDKKIKDETKKEAIEALRKVLSRYERSLNNINRIASDFEKEINKED